MAGNTRGKLKEHFEGIHRNLDWCSHHIVTSLALIEAQLREVNALAETPLDETALLEKIAAYPMMVGVKALGDGITTLDGLTQDVYSTL